MPIEDEIDVKVVVEGIPAPEFPAEPQTDEMTGRQVLTKYVQVTSGTQFLFQVTLSPQYRFGKEDCLTLYAFIDGEFAGGIVWDRERHSHVFGSKFVCSSKWEGNGAATRKLTYHFADLKICEIADTDELKEMASKYGQLGTLQVKLERTEKGERVDRINRVATTFQGDESVPEKALKGRSVTVAAKMKPAEFAVESHTSRVTHLDEKPLYMKRFLYRTKEALQSEMVIARSPSPEPLEDQEEEDLTPEQMRELIRRQKEQLAVKQKNKAPRLKRERPLSSTAPMRPLKSTRTDDGKTIFHLDSDDDEPAPKPWPTPTLTPKKQAEPAEIIDLD